MRWIQILEGDADKYLEGEMLRNTCMEGEIMDKHMERDAEKCLDVSLNCDMTSSWVFLFYLLACCIVGGWIPVLLITPRHPTTPHGTKFLVVLPSNMYFRWTIIVWTSHRINIYTSSMYFRWKVIVWTPHGTKMYLRVLLTTKLCGVLYNKC